MKYIDAERLRVEIERRREKCADIAADERNEEVAEYYRGKEVAYDETSSLITSLQQEQPECGSSEKPNNPAEWSEEDKRKLNRIYEILGYAADDKGFLTSKRIIGDKEAIELQDFLKSLRPQPHWRPSEEQMKIFNEAIEHYSKYWDSEDIKILCSLYDDLKKL